MKQISLILSFLFFLSIINIIKTDSIQDKIKKLEGNLINNYTQGNDSVVDEILESIKELDESIYERDLEIINYWHYIDDEMKLNEDVAPYYLPKTADHAFVLLGFGLNDDGSLKPEAIGRCEVAYKSALRYPKSKLYITGGGTAKNNSTATEAGQMREYILKKGLDAKRIIIEVSAMTTVQNARNTVKLLYQNHVKSITIITSDYHIRRSNILFKGEIMLKADTYSSAPISIIQNAVYKTGRATEGKYYEGTALASIMGVSLKLTLLLQNMPKVLMNLFYTFTD
jgi:uncharacterized SAM-binding protein YcdF (DUF218 family)